MTSSRMRDPSTPSEILYSAYRFLTLDELFRLPEQDVQFLELNGCLHLPTRSVQDELVHQYFLYVHPCFPCIDEAEFWDLYLNRDQHDGTRKTMSLLVFQGMLFASSAVGTKLYFHVFRLLTPAVCLSSRSQVCWLFRSEGGAQHVLPTRQGRQPINQTSSG